MRKTKTIRAILSVTHGLISLGLNQKYCALQHGRRSVGDGGGAGGAGGGRGGGHVPPLFHVGGGSI